MTHSIRHLLHHQNRYARWRDRSFLSPSHYPKPLWPWLNDQGSLTSRLVALSNQSFYVEVLRQEIDIPCYHEQDQLGQRHGSVATVREVILHVDGKGVVAARSIIPLTLIHAYGSGLTELGSKPLGHLLFVDGRARMSKRQFCHFRNADSKPVFARRTPYEYMGATILVAEFFLPSLQEII